MLIPVNKSNYQTNVVLTNGLEFWTESFGDKTKPAILLIMGSGGQAILWPQDFCELLAGQGYFVIRYDNRDTGLSSSINYQKNPYTLLDMAHDAIGIMDHYQIEQAHVVGGSMGGSIALLMSAHFSKRISKLSLLMTTIDMRAAFDTFCGLPTQSTLSKPSDTVLEMIKNMAINPPISILDNVSSFIHSTKINNPKLQIDEATCRQLALQVFLRTKNPAGMTNHFQAAMASYDLLENIASKITVPTNIIHGDSDQIFPVDHAYATQNAIQQSNLAIIPKMGHGLQEEIYTSVIENLLSEKVCAEEKLKNVS